MGIRETLAEKPAVAGAVAGTGLLLAAFFVYVNTRPATNPLQLDRWAFDLNEGVVIRATLADAPPFATGSGTFAYPGIGPAGAGVDAMLYSCGDCTHIEEGMTREQLAEVQARIGIVSRLSPDALEVRADWARGVENPRSSDTMLISGPDGGRWLRDQTGPALGLRAAALAPCPDGSRPLQCVPF